MPAWNVLRLSCSQLNDLLSAYLLLCLHERQGCTCNRSCTVLFVVDWCGMVLHRQFQLLANELEASS